jgi:DnaJ-class molecular chaperone
MKPAQECQGPGVRVKMQQLAPGFVQQVQQRDDRCVARGKMWRPNCKECPQGQTQTEKIDLTLDISKGMRPGERITFEGVADEKPGYSAGDLNFVIFESENDLFHRDGDQLYKTMEIPLVDALVSRYVISCSYLLEWLYLVFDAVSWHMNPLHVHCSTHSYLTLLKNVVFAPLNLFQTGFKVELTHLDGHKFTVNVDGVTECDHVMRVPGKGMPRRSGRGFGDLYLTFEVDFPDELRQDQKDAIKKILGGGASASGNDEF